MEPTDIVYASAIRLAAEIRMGRLSSEEVLDAHLDRIARVNPVVNAIVTLDEEGARKRARAADSALRDGHVWGPLHGVPITVKDALETAGLRTTAGWPPLADYVPETDATVVARLRAAGAVILGKTNIPPLSASTQTANAIFGVTNNPWDVSRTPGGSTGGGAAAVASGMSPLEIGADIGGSLRIPAGYCGVYAMKPTEHRVPNSGHIPPPPGIPHSIRHMNVVGPIARTVDDLELALRIIAGPDLFDFEVSQVPLELRQRKPLFTLRLAWSIDLGAPGHEGAPVAAEMRAAMERLIGLLEGRARRVEEALPAGFDLREGNTAWRAILDAECDWTLLRDAKGLWQPTPNMQQYSMFLMRRDDRIGALERFFRDWDALLCPVTAGPAFHHLPFGGPVPVDGAPVEHWLATTAFTTHFNLTGNPVVVVPMGLTSDGLPLGLQIVGKRWDEGGILAIAREIAALLRPLGHPPICAGPQDAAVRA